MTTIPQYRNIDDSPLFQPNFCDFNQPTHRNKFDDEASRQKLTKMIMRLFEHWKISTADQLEGTFKNCTNFLFHKIRQLVTRRSWRQNILSKSALDSFQLKNDQTCR
jgi:hypothetical protein